ncbi:MULTISPECIES: phage terminase large subunit [Halocynthiibacter]|uniref:Phage terminase large subunit n=1 Tax=Halocynthiibacter halioticoli TaxID=2986804 RepID=A0AAE3J397_9RHOB|nr:MULTISPECIES: phage terminase large subunit [Halocynthiibacter]MCV6826013.1 phage terminase large subunit [Halocynthiibacter halioticoli]MCW4059014.1 phage terminase large subunit [Halocynthiibacter sp. SDUM655004]
MKYTSEEELLFNLLEEEEKREAQNSFLAYYMRMTGFTPELHHKIICKLLQSMDEDKVDRAMVFLPPRMAKSTLCTMLFPSWLIGKYPKTQIMSGVHTQRFADKMGKIVRNYVRNAKYPFKTELAKDSQAKSAWGTTEGGEYNGFGLMGGSTHGNPAEWLIMDDLIKGRKMALSAHMREEAWETYKADLLTRLQGRRKQLIVTTRWHEDDPAGRILPADFDGKTGWYKDRETGEKWFVLSIPALAEHENDPLGRKIGEWLWPAKWGAKAWAAVRNRGGYIWSALYQQRPSPEEGLMFNDEHIMRYNPAQLDTTTLQIYGTSDYAVTAEAGNNDPDYTVHQIWGVDPEFNIYLLDMWRGRTTSDVWVDQFIRLVRKWKPLRWFEESGQIINGVGPFLKRQMQQERVFVNRVGLTSSTSKEQRAQSLLGMASMGKMYLPDRDKVQKYLLNYLDAFEKELKAFPAAKHDDTVDPATLFARGLDRIIAGKPFTGPDPEGETLDQLHARHEAEKRARERGRRR